MRLKRKKIVIHTNQPLISPFYIKRYLVFPELAMLQRRSTIFCETGVWGAKPTGRERVNLYMIISDMFRKIQRAIWENVVWQKRTIPASSPAVSITNSKRLEPVSNPAKLTLTVFTVEMETARKPLLETLFSVFQVIRSSFVQRKNKTNSSHTWNPVNFSVKFSQI